MRKTAFLLILAFLQACGDARWVKAGADEAALERDLTTCRAGAAEKAARMGSMGPPSPSMDPRFGSAPGGPTSMDLRIQERQAEERCMRDKGYALVPAGT